MENSPTLESVLNELPNHLDDADWLSRACVELGMLLVTHNHEMARSHRLEAEAAFTAMREAKDMGDKMSNAEADRIATIRTEDAYTDYKLSYEAMVELINSIKTRLKVIGWEYEKSGNQ